MIKWCGMFHKTFAMLKPRWELVDAVEMYKGLIDASPEAVTVTDVFGNIQFSSPQTYRLHGYQLGELDGKTAFALIHPDDHERAGKNLKVTLDKGRVGPIEYSMLRKDGSTFIGELNASLVRNKFRQPSAFIATVRDVTEKKALEQSIRKLEDFKVHEKQFRTYTSALQLAGVPIILWNDKGIVFTNRKTVSLTGFSHFGLSQKKMSDLIFEEDREVYCKHVSLMKELDEGHSAVIKTRIVTKSKRLIDVEISDANTGVGNGSPVYFSMITDRDYIEEKIESHSERIAILLEKRGLNVSSKEDS